MKTVVQFIREHNVNKAVFRGKNICPSYDVILEQARQERVIYNKLFRAGRTNLLPILAATGKVEQYIPVLYKYCPFDFMISRNPPKQVILEWHNNLIFSFEESIEEMEDVLNILPKHVILRINPPDFFSLFSSVNCLNKELAIQLAFLIFDRGKFTQIVIR